MTCPSCGNNLPDGSSFCTKCGIKISHEPISAEARENDGKGGMEAGPDVAASGTAVGGTAASGTTVGGTAASGTTVSGTTVGGTAANKSFVWKDAYTYIVIAFVIVLAAIIGLAVKFHNDGRLFADKERGGVTSDYEGREEEIPDKEVNHGEDGTDAEDGRSDNADDIDARKDAGEDADDGNAGDGNADNGNADNGNADDGNANNGNADNGNANNGNADNGNADNGNAGDGNVNNGVGEESTEDFPTASNDRIQNCYASSELVESQYNLVHGAWNVLDGDTKTAWSEAASGMGIGESLTIVLDSKCEINGISLLNGYQASEVLYWKNSRSSEIEISFSDGTSETLSLKDTLGWQTFYFSERHVSDEIQIIIRDAYAGNKCEDTLITEVEIF